MFTGPRRDAAGERAPCSRNSSILGGAAARPTKAFGARRATGAFGGIRWLQAQREGGRCVSAGDFHAGARGRGDSCGDGGRYLARNRVSSPRWGLQPRRLPQLLSSPAPRSCATIPAVQRPSFVVTLPAIAMEIRASPFHSRRNGTLAGAGTKESAPSRARAARMGAERHVASDAVGSAGDPVDRPGAAPGTAPTASRPAGSGAVGPWGPPTHHPPKRRLTPGQVALNPDPVGTGDLLHRLQPWLRPR